MYVYAYVIMLGRSPLAVTVTTMDYSRYNKAMSCPYSGTATARGTHPTYFYIHIFRSTYWRGCQGSFLGVAARAAVRQSQGPLVLRLPHVAASKNQRALIHTPNSRAPV